MADALTVPTPHLPAGRVSPLVVEASETECAAVLATLGTSPGGLTADKAARRLVEYGPNVAAKDARYPRLRLLRKTLVNLLAVLSTSSFLTGDARAGAVILLMVAVGVAVRFVQEARVEYAGPTRGQGDETDRADARPVAEYASRERPAAWQAPRPEVSKMTP